MKELKKENLELSEALKELRKEKLELSEALPEKLKVLKQAIEDASTCAIAFLRGSR